MVMTRGTFSRDLQDGINSHFGLEYKQHKPEYSEIYEKKTSKRAFEEMIMRVGLGEAQEKPEGGLVTFDAGAQGWISRVDFYTYALAFSITEEAIDDNLYADLAEVYGKELARALQHAREVRGASLLNNSEDDSFTGGDARPLLDLDHPLYAGGAFSNKLETAADLSEEAIEDLCVMIDGFVNDRGRPIVIKPKQLIYPRQLRFTAARIRTSTKRVGTNLNDPNVIKDEDVIPKWHLNHWLIDPDAFWLQTDCDQGMMYWERKGIKKGMETQFGTGNMQYKASFRIGFSWTNPRCMTGSSGSALNA